MVQFNEFQLHRCFGNYSCRSTVEAWVSHAVNPSLKDSNESLYVEILEQEIVSEDWDQEFQSSTSQGTNSCELKGSGNQEIKEMSLSSRSNRQLALVGTTGSLPNLPFVTGIRPAPLMGSRRAFYGTYFFKDIHIIEFSEGDNSVDVSGFAISKLKHNNILNSLYYGESDGFKYVGYEVAEFELLSHLKGLAINQTFDVSTYFKKCLYQVLSVFDFVHSRGWSKF